MLFANIDGWVQYYVKANNIKEKDIRVDVFSQALVKDGKIKDTQVTVIRDKNFETADVYFNDNYAYTVYNSNEKFQIDFEKRQIRADDSAYSD